MKKLVLTIFFFIATLSVFAQTEKGRTMTGVIKEPAGSTLPGTHVKLISDRDSLYVRTNVDGIFNFKNVLSSVFYLTVSSPGYHPLTSQKTSIDLSADTVILDTITLKPIHPLINCLPIVGRPNIVYKMDTVQYNTSYYNVRPKPNLPSY